jgi:shikimate dehydrogenase
MTPKTATPQYGIIGHPLGHTLSPALHNWALARAGLPGEYRACPLEPAGLPAFMDGMRDGFWTGLSVTIPHKVAVMEFLDDISPRARRAGAVNTVYRDGGRLLGDNTDVPGFLAPLRALNAAPESALVLGAGGAARAVLAGLAELGVPRVLVTARSLPKAQALAAAFGAQATPWEQRASAPRAELVVNTTPLGMRGVDQGQSPWPATALFTPGQIAYDLVYNPRQTVFLARACAMAARIIGGMEMFLHQGSEQFRLWTGKTFDLPAARTLVSELLGRK